MAEHPAVSRFRDYLRIKTVHPNPDYKTCALFLEKQAKEMGLPCQVWESAPGKPVVVITWQGSDPTLSSIMLNSHTDVVPVFEDKWKYPPFDAVKLENGDIIARGAQDMKMVGMGYLEAIRNLRAINVKLPRTMHVVFVPDEEIGGSDGMATIVNDERFKALNVAFALDEGLANPGDAFKVYYGERAPWWIKFKAEGNVGHGSQFIKGAAASKIHKLLNKLLAFREAEEIRFHNGRRENGTKLTLGDVTTANWTMLSGGVQYNVVPATMELGFDVRVSPSLDLASFEMTLKSWCEECGCTMEFVQYCPSNPVTPLTPDNSWWLAIKKASEDMNIRLEAEVFPAATDSRYVRLAGIPAIGISPMNNTPILLHDHNEYLNENIYLKGIKWYERVLQHLGHVTEEQEKLSPKLLV